MRLRNLVDDDSAVSPVIGVILMVAITVILAAVIASFVLGLGGQTDVAPTSDFSFNYDADGDKVTINHAGGDNIRASELHVRGDGIATGQMTHSENWHTNATNTPNTAGQATASGTLSGNSAVVSGDSWTVEVTGSDYVLRVVWEATEGGTSSELRVNRGPDA